MSLHVIVENRNKKMPHTGFPQRARTFTAEKADCFLFNNKGKNQPPFLPPRTSCWTWAQKEPGCCSGSESSFLLPCSLCRGVGRNWDPFNQLFPDIPGL